MTMVTTTTLNEITTYLFDLDGVLTPTAEVHMRAWAKMFSQVFNDFAVAPYTDQDYFDHLDGKPRYAGVADLLANRNIALPYGDPLDSADMQTVCGLGNRKNDVFTEVLQTEGVRPYPGSIALVDALIAGGKQVAVVSSSRNATAVLAAARIADRFEVVVDGLVAANRGILGKPAPDTYLYAAQLLGTSPAHAAVIEDAPSGVAAGRAGDFGIVIGVDRGAGRDVLLQDGADVVVDDLVELLDGEPTGQSPASKEGS